MELRKLAIPTVMIFAILLLAALTVFGGTSQRVNAASTKAPDRITIATPAAVQAAQIRQPQPSLVKMGIVTEANDTEIVDEISSLISGLSQNDIDESIIPQ